MNDTICPECGGEMYNHDTTYSNIDTHRCSAGDHTGTIYKCRNEECEALYIDDYLNNSFYSWSY